MINIYNNILTSFLGFLFLLKDYVFVYILVNIMGDVILVDFLKYGLLFHFPYVFINLIIPGILILFSFYLFFEKKIVIYLLFILGSLIVEMVVLRIYYDRIPLEGYIAKLLVWGIFNVFSYKILQLKKGYAKVIGKK